MLKLSPKNQVLYSKLRRKARELMNLPPRKNQEFWLDISDNIPSSVITKLRGSLKKIGWNKDQVIGAPGGVYIIFRRK